MQKQREGLHGLGYCGGDGNLETILKKKETHTRMDPNVNSLQGFVVAVWVSLCGGGVRFVMFCCV